MVTKYIDTRRKDCSKET